MDDFFKYLLLASASGAMIVAFLYLIKPVVRKRTSKTFQYYCWFLPFARFLFPFAVGNIFIGCFAPSMQNQAPVSTGGISGNITMAPTPSVTPGTAMSTAFLNTVHSGGLLINNWGFPFLALWLLGTVAFLGVSLIGYLQYIGEIKKTRTKVTDQSALMILEQCKKKLKLRRSVPLYVSFCIDTPMLCGVFKTFIILPDRSLSSEQLRHALLHELVHYRRHDCIVKWLAVIAVSIHWFNPFAYLALREFGRQCELSCDEVATADFSKEERIGYGRTLLAMASDEHKPFELQASMSENKRNLKERLEVLTHMKKKSRKLSVPVLSVALVLTVATVLLSGAGKVAAKQQNEISSIADSGTTVSSATSNSDSSSDIGLSSKLSDTVTLPEITNNVDAAWKTKYADIAITNAWIGANYESDNRLIVLCGALKSDSRQGVAEVIQFSKSKNSVTYEKRYFAPAKHGALKVFMLGAKDTTMVLSDEDGLKWNFQFYNGFDPSTPISQ